MGPGGWWEELTTGSCLDVLPKWRVQAADTSGLRLRPGSQFPPTIPLHALCQKKGVFPVCVGEVSVPCGRHVLSSFLPCARRCYALTI